MEHTIPLDPENRADTPQDDGTSEVCADVAYKRLMIVNVAFYGAAGAPSGTWVLIDAGVMGTKGRILDAVEQRYGAGSRPAAIILTHGHSDHTGTLEDLASLWDVPIYAHELEVPYLDGTASYPPPDPSVGGGLMSLLSPLFPPGPINVKRWLRPLPADGSVPVMPGWRWIHTPGHTPGHISLWRESDRMMIVGDAFITTNQESAYAVATQRTELHGPPMYYTQDWDASRRSVQRLAALEPETVITGHGRAMHGAELRDALHTLARDFDRIAVPEEGRYLEHPARASDGSAYNDPE